MARPKKKTCRILLISSQAKAGEAAQRTFTDAGYTVTNAVPARDKTLSCEVVVVLLDHDHPEPGALDGLRRNEEYPPPIVVFGPPRGKKWRRDALDAGAFACLSGNAPRADQAGLVSAASRYRAAQMENQLIRRETDIVVQGLLESFGSEAQKLQKVVREAKGVRESLDEVQKRIILKML